MEMSGPPRLSHPVALAATDNDAANVTGPAARPAPVATIVASVMALDAEAMTAFASDSLELPRESSVPLQAKRTKEPAR
jgi:hypothetical protein